jgi:hypothetical protein
VRASKLVIVLDSKAREQTVGQIVEALSPLERDGLIEIEPSLITGDLNVVERVGAKKPQLVIAHLHAFGGGDSNAASGKLLRVFESLAEGNAGLVFLVYSGAFAMDPAAGRMWVSHAIEGLTLRGGQADGSYPPFLDRVETIAIRDESPFPPSTRVALRSAVTRVLLRTTGRPGSGAVSRVRPRPDGPEASSFTTSISVHDHRFICRKAG